tara:strand:+ start:1733 stop:1939 length:207 start_codon:yes stop_codon:yes gene_type:complete
MTEKTKNIDLKTATDEELNNELTLLMQGLQYNASRPYLEFIYRVLIDEITIGDFAALINTISKGRGFE